MTIVTGGDDAVLEQIDKQLNKLVDVIKVTDLTGSGFVAREMMLIKVRAAGDSRGEVMQLANIFKAAIVHVEHEILVVELTGRSEKLDAFIELMRQFGIIEIARTGKVALARAAAATESLEVVTHGAGPQAGDQ
jgi:acetolactate synthase-1/3 small subunit